MSTVNNVDVLSEKECDELFKGFASAVEPTDISDDDDWAKAMVEQIDDNPQPFEETTIVPASANQNMLKRFMNEREMLRRNVDEHFAALNTAISKRDLVEELFQSWCEYYGIDMEKQK